MIGKLFEKSRLSQRIGIKYTYNCLKKLLLCDFLVNNRKFFVKYKYRYVLVRQVPVGSFSRLGIHVFLSLGLIGIDMKDSFLD